MWSMEIIRKGHRYVCLCVYVSLTVVHIHIILF